MTRIALLLTLLLFAAHAAAADDFNDRIDQDVADLMQGGAIRSDVGVTRRGTRIPGLITADDLDLRAAKTRVLLVGGLDGGRESVAAVRAALEWFHSDDAERFRRRFALSAVPIANPDGWGADAGPGNLVGGNPTRGYPPAGAAYSSPTDPEAAYLWRWIGLHAPDLVVVVSNEAETGWRVPAGADDRLKRLAGELSAAPATAGDDLASQLVRHSPANVGPVPALSVSAKQSAFLKSLLTAAERAGFTGPSPARKELQSRIDRTPLEVAIQLSRRYGRDLDAVTYIPAMALVGRLSLGELTGDPSHRADVESIVAPFVERKKPALPERTSGMTLSGHLVFGELARRTDEATGRRRYVELVRAAADLGFDDDGRPQAVMPFHNEMSDAVFMGGPILAQAGRLTGEAKYHDMAVRHQRFMLRLSLRPEGLHRHSPLDETPWGRGNGFAALGLALTLSDLPEQHPGRDELLDAFRSHIAALKPHQDATGMWRQVIDHPASYRELSCTCMITFSLVRGIRNGWLDAETYQPVIDRAVPAILARIAPDGGLVDVCTGTGKQQSLRDYLDRTALLGPDPRGGAMSLLVTTELARPK